MNDQWARFATTTEALRSFFKCAAAAAWNDIRAAKNEEERKLTQRPYVTSILRQHLKLTPYNLEWTRFSTKIE
ncbi:hypothetical protein T05_12286 [Trichinella murrelli]|uniref:Uncharacterized protein n=1 Tax=Trichinella murrelli TaxID=144512 RepID=A0A0V0UF56_9BILA|nr:hypothetical protein T05_12286 [Trichinella murrelli]